MVFDEYDYLEKTVESLKDRTRNELDRDSKPSGTEMEYPRDAFRHRERSPYRHREPSSSRILDGSSSRRRSSLDYRSWDGDRELHHSGRNNRDDPVWDWDREREKTKERGRLERERERSRRSRSHSERHREEERERERSRRSKSHSERHREEEREPEWREKSRELGKGKVTGNPDPVEQSSVGHWQLDPTQELKS